MRQGSYVVTMPDERRPKWLPIAILSVTLAALVAAEYLLVSR